MNQVTLHGFILQPGDTNCSTAHSHRDSNKQKISLMELGSELKKLIKKSLSRAKATAALIYPSKLFKMKGLKIYNDEDIKSKTGLEKMRRFWNEKVELLCTHSETANLMKTKI